MVFELGAKPPRVIKAGEAFGEPGGDVIHYQDANNHTDIPLRFLVTMMMAPGQPMLVFLDDDELKQSGWVRRSPGLVDLKTRTGWGRPHYGRAPPGNGLENLAGSRGPVQRPRQ